VTTTGIFTIHTYTISGISEGKPIYIIPVGDIHRSAPLCHEERWAEFCKWAARKKDAYFLGMGDYDDMASTSERIILKDPKLHESSRKTLDSIYRSHTERLAKEMKFMRGRTIGVLGGNHYADLMNGTTTDHLLAERLQTSYLGVSSFIRLRLIPTRGTRLSVDIWAHHGKGASRLAGGSINRVQQMAEAAEADIYLMGHDHKKSAAFISRLRLAEAGNCGDVRLRQRKVLLARTGSFLKGYVHNEPSYVTDAALSPTDLGVVKIELTLKREQRKDGSAYHVDIHASV